jgi:hypothetical protein
MEGTEVLAEGSAPFVIALTTILMYYALMMMIQRVPFEETVTDLLVIISVRRKGEQWSYVLNML